MRRLDDTKCPFCGRSTMVYEEGDGQICVKCLAKILSFHIRCNREPETKRHLKAKN